MQDPASVKQAVEEPVREDRFPHDRVVFFCDAVFAIVITLLAIELRLPSSELVAKVGLEEAWNETVGLFISYIISFFVTGLFWSGHMMTWKYVTRVNSKLVWLALLQLFFVVLMPFATREYASAMSGNASAWFVFYAAVLTGISLFSLLTRRCVVKQEQLRERIGAAQTRWLLARGVIPFAVFAATIPVGFFIPGRWAAMLFVLIFPLFKLTKRRIFAQGD